MEDDLSEWRAPELATIAATFDVDETVLQLVLDHLDRSSHFPILSYAPGKLPISIYLDLQYPIRKSGFATRSENCA
ncbi:hypothetical protein GA0070624_2103 [Micromonospora rhizosphaerae]|uniref:Uncharacterized protein n=1 Tax=Micromonospora rhizosphaerae TaxID=568872 RepID=A0A1C6RUK6_9ACTN|nr:hypothetical protein GA0070624_2103 [Micromonospora rhizosphaerae]